MAVSCSREQVVTQLLVHKRWVRLGKVRSFKLHSNFKFWLLAFPVTSGTLTGRHVGSELGAHLEPVVIYLDHVCRVTVTSFGCLICNGGELCR